MYTYMHFQQMDACSVCWSPLPPPLCSKSYRFAEFFAGTANISAALRGARLIGVSLDIAYTGKAMDILSDSGMGYPGSWYIHKVL